MKNGNGSERMAYIVLIDYIYWSYWKFQAKALQRILFKKSLICKLIYYFQSAVYQLFIATYCSVPLPFESMYVAQCGLEHVTDHQKPVTGWNPCRISEPEQPSVYGKHYEDKPYLTMAYI